MISLNLPKSQQKFICEENGIRLDKFLVQQIPNLSRSKIQNAIINKFVKVNGSIESKHYFLKQSDVIEIDFTEITKKQTQIEGNLDLKIVFEDDDILVINKDAGIIAHKFAEQQEYSLADELIKRYPFIKNIGDDPTRPGIVHRLDKNVSGLMVIAKSQKAFENLKKQFQKRTIEKEYIALVNGKINSQFGTIDFRVGRSGNSKNKMSAFPSNSEFGKDALTEFDLISHYKNNSLLRVKIKTGRTHQIRVHMMALGYPVVGDTVYNKTQNQNKLKNDLKLKENRIFLHSCKLSFKHPLTKKKLTFETSLPIDLKNTLNTLTAHKKIILVSAPSGGGKTTLIKYFLEKHSDFDLTTTYTTREKRENAIEDKIMVTVKKSEFKKLLNEGAFLEWSEFNGNYYGTHKESILKTLKEKNILINIDVNGANQIRKQMPEVYSIFIDSDDNSLKRRILDRGGLSEEDIIERVEKIAPIERLNKPLYDKVIFNKDGDLDNVKNEFEKVVLQFLELI